MENHPIGIFDSGIGGLTVAHALKEKLPNESIIYFGDTKHLPYGEKSNKAIQHFSEGIVKFLIKKRCKAIIIACNSASSVAFDVVKKIANTVPVFNVIDPVVRHVAKECTGSKIGVIGTKATIKSNVYAKKIQKFSSEIQVSSLATPLLVPMIEEGFVSGKISDTIISNYLSNKKIENIDHLILACTHYPLIHKKIEKFYNYNINVINSSKIVVKHIEKELKKNGLIKLKKEKKYLFFTSNYTDSLEDSARFFFHEAIKLQELNIWR